MNDQELLREYTTRGSEESFRSLVERYLNLTYSAVLRQVRDPELARDVTQVVFLTLARKAGRLPDNIILSAWLYRTARLATLHALRGECRRQRWEQEAAAMSVTINQPEAETPWADIAPQLDEAMADLGERERAAILLRYFENKSLRETGVALGISEDAAQKRLERAVEKLRSLLKRRKVAVPALLLTTALGAQAVQVAPAGLAAAAVGAALQGIGLSATAATIFQATSNAITWTKLHTAAAGGMAILLLGAGLETRTSSTLAQENKSLAAAAPNLAQVRAENAEFQRLQAQGQALAQLRRDSADLQRMRAEAAQLRAELGELEKLRAENGQLRAAFPGLTLIKDLAKVKAAGQPEICLNHLKQICIAGQAWAVENGHRWPLDFVCTSNGLSTPIILRCPADKARSTPRTWDEVAAGNMSYQSFALGTVPDEGKIYAWCPIHHQGITAHGRVAGPSPDSAILALPEPKGPSK